MLTVSSLAKKIHGTVEGDVNFKINGVGDLRTSPKDFVSFLSDERYYKFFEDSSSNVVIVNNKFSNPRLDKILIRVENPVYAYIQTLEHFGFKQNSKKADSKQMLVMRKFCSVELLFMVNFCLVGFNVRKYFF